ncbi:MAG: MFS transporter [Coxiellaceae bacterium]|nr:MFS transporter [Coxiellaceae bacterium]
MQRTLALSAVGLATMLFAIDISVVNTALPAIQSAFSASYLELRWIIDAFSIFLVSLLIPAGIIGDRFSETRVLYWGLTIFFVACTIAGLAQTFTELLVGRALQGVGMASLFPTTLAVATHQYPPEEKTKAVSIWSAYSGVGLAIGPVLGGFIVSFTTWRWIFLFNLPLIILAIILGFLSLRPKTNQNKSLKLHWQAMIVFALAVAGLITAVLEEPNWGISSPWVWGMIIAAILLFYLLYIMERNQAHPLIHFSLFKQPIYVKSSCITFSCGLFLYSILYLAPLYLHDVLQHHGYQLGLLMLPISVSLVISSRLVSTFTKICGLKRLLGLSLLLMAIADLMQLHFSIQHMPVYLCVTFALMGFSWGIAYAGSTSYALSVIPDEHTATASSLFMTIRNFGGGFGLAISGTLFYHIRNSTLTGPLAQHFDHKSLQKLAFLHGFYAAVILLAAFAIVSLLILQCRTRTSTNKTDHH